MLNHLKSEPVWTRERALTLAALIGCLSIYGITISLFTPLLSLILESRGLSSTLIGGLAMMTPGGIIIGSFTFNNFSEDLLKLIVGIMGFLFAGHYFLFKKEIIIIMDNYLELMKKYPQVREV